MPEAETELARQRAAIARAEKDARRHPDDIARHKVTELRAIYAARKLKDFIEKVVATAPPLTDEQTIHLSGLLRPQVAECDDTAERV
jgi:hypothetical protein